MSITKMEIRNILALTDIAIIRYAINYSVILDTQSIQSV